MKQVVAAEARDDRGLREAHLVRWRVRARGGSDQVIEERIPLDGEPQRTSIRRLIDASKHRLLPGDEIHYFVRVRDNSPGGQSAVSMTYILRLPGHPELRNRVRDEGTASVRESAALGQTGRAREG